MPGFGLIRGKRKMRYEIGFDNGNINNVMDGDIDGFINAYLSLKA